MKYAALALLALLAIASPALAQQLNVIGPVPPCTTFGTGSGTCAQGNDSRITGALQTGPLWKVARITSNQTISGVTTINFNSSVYDTASVCNTTSTWVCTPTLAGYYTVTCSAFIAGTAGPVLGGYLGKVAIMKNGSEVEQAILLADVAIVASPTIYLSRTTIIQVNGSNDTIGCQAYSEDTNPIVALGANNTTFSGSFVHP